MIHKYYQQRPEQSQLQVALLQKVIALTTQSTSTSTPNEARIGEELAEFVSSYAGTEHVMTYGICLQKQALDPTRYPKTARMQTGHRPYLYRYKNIFYLLLYILNIFITFLNKT